MTRVPHSGRKDQSGSGAVTSAVWELNPELRQCDSSTLSYRQADTKVSLSSRLSVLCLRFLCVRCVSTWKVQQVSPLNIPSIPEGAFR